MSSGSHLTKDSYDLIKSIGEAQSKQEEDKIMTQEYQQLKIKIQEKNLSSKQQRECILKAIYLEMLGHDASFAYIYAVNQTQHKYLNLKKIGYLACSLFFHENSEFLILLVSTIQKDLMSQNIHEQMIALNVLSKLLYESIVNAVIKQVLSLTVHKNGIIRKKAIMICYRIYLISPQNILDFNERIKKGLCDQDPSVMGAVLNIYFEQIKQQGANKFKDLISSFVVILKQIIENKLSRDYDYHRMPAPWIQIKLLQIIGLLAQNDSKASEHVYEIIGMALDRSDDTGINIGYSLVYQCVKTIAQIYPNRKLLEQAAISIAKFFHSGNNNLKYLGINALKMLMNVDPKYASNHQLTVVESLESTDETLRRETLELLFKMTNQDNIEVIMERLMNHLKISNDQFFKKEMIIQLIEKYAPSQDWFFMNINYLFDYASEHINDEILNEIIKIIYEISQDDDDFNQLMFDTYERYVQNQELSDPYIKLISWIFGQIGSSYYRNNQQKLKFIVDQLIMLVDSDFQDLNTKSWIINSLAKLNYVYTDKKQIQEIFKKVLIQKLFIYKKYQFSKKNDISQRSSEYILFPNFLQNLSKSENIQKVDQSLSFLNNFVQQARNQGAKEYKDSLFQKCFLNSQQSSQSQQLVFQPYSVSNQRSIIQNESNDTGLQIQGSQKWGKSGYVKEEKDTVLKANPSYVSSSQITSISSDKTQSQGGYANSSNYSQGKEKQVLSAGGVTHSNYQQNAFQDTQKPVTKSYIDPKEKQKLQLANQLFGKPAVKPQQTFTKPKQQQDLIDLPSQTPKILLQPLNIKLEEYENYWEQFPDELSIDLKNSKIKTLQQFQQCNQILNFKIIEVINNEVICAANYNENIILLYAEFSSQGNFSFKIKAKNQQDQNFVADIIKNQVQ